VRGKPIANHKRDPKAHRHLYFSRKTAHFLLFVPENKIKGWAVAEINKVAEFFPPFAPFPFMRG